MQKVSSGYFDATYGFEERKHCEGANRYIASARITEANDADGDRVNDCKIKWLRQYTASLQEVRLDEQGLPTGASGMTVAVAASHLQLREHLRSDAVHEELKELWTWGLANEMRSRYPTASVRAMGGDLNVHRCRNKNEPTRHTGDYPSQGQCDTLSWWSRLMAGTPEPTPLPHRWRLSQYRDGVYQIHGPNDDRLEDQYRDGCDGFDQVDGSCIDHPSFKRIDFIFGALAPVIGSSRDVTCGILGDGSEFAPNCDDVFNPERYSDHRLVWSLMGRSQSE